MSLKRMCDFCNREIEGEKFTKIILKEGGEDKTLDMCDGCFERLMSMRGIFGGAESMAILKKKIFGEEKRGLRERLMGKP